MIGLVLGATMALLPAHPLGNFSVNQLVSLTLHPDRVEAVAVVDLAELPSLQLKPTCAEISSALMITVNGRSLDWTAGPAEVTHAPGAAGLQTSRVTCQLSAAANLSGTASIDVVNTYQPERLGWREMTATGSGLRVIGLPSASVTDQLRSYPEDLLSTPPDVRYAHLSVQAGISTDIPLAQAAGTQPGIYARAESWLQDTVGDRTLTPLVGLLAVLLAMILGAGHALLPGHGKTVMAIYLAGRAGRPRDALFVGATVTATHTGGVLALGLLLTGVSSLAGESVLGWLGIASGTLVTAVGVTMLTSALRARHPHTHPRDPHTPTPAAADPAAADHARATHNLTPTAHHHTHVVHDAHLLATPGHADATHDHPYAAHDTHACTEPGHAPVAAAFRHQHALHAPGHHQVSSRNGASNAHNHHAHTRNGSSHTHESHHGAPARNGTSHTHASHDQVSASNVAGHHHASHYRTPIRHGASQIHPSHDHASTGNSASHSHADRKHAEHDHVVSHRGSHHHGHHHHHGGVFGTFGKGHRHEHPSVSDARQPGPRRFALAALGIAGGLVPSPSALIVLLGAIALGRTGFGILLVLAYGLGMAATLTVAGLALLKVRDRMRGRFRFLSRFAPAAPYATGGLVLVVGIGLAARAATLVM